MTKEQQEKEIQSLKLEIDFKHSRIDELKNQVKIAEEISKDVDILNQDLIYKDRILSDIRLITNTFIMVNYPTEFIYSESGRQVVKNNNKDKLLLERIVKLSETEHMQTGYNNGAELWK